MRSCGECAHVPCARVMRASRAMRRSDARDALRRAVCVVGCARDARAPTCDASGVRAACEACSLQCACDTRPMIVRFA
eukprot:3133311-Pleurochrysis_carterae.AAC.1